MSRVVFLLEERSMKELLEGLLPRLFPGLPFLCIPHEGKRDLERSIPRKLRAWREPGASGRLSWRTVPRLGCWLALATSRALCPELRPNIEGEAVRV